MACKTRRCTLLIAAALLSGPARAADPPPADDGLDAILWMQTSIEAEANATGAFALARLRLDQALADKAWTAAPAEQTGDFRDLPPAIISEVDDTLLSTAAYQAWTVKDRTRFNEKSWARYIQAQRDTAIAGAVDFTNYAVSKGVAVFYISNRAVESKAATVSEMKTLGFPVGTGDTFLALKQEPNWMAAKSTRRAFVGAHYRVLLLIGDQLGDFTDDYKGDVAERQAVFERAQSHWGHDWIMLANPTYGSFEAAPYKGSAQVSPEDKRERKIGALKAWDGK